MSDLLYVGITIVVFGVLFLIVKGVERSMRSTPLTMRKRDRKSVV